MNIGQVTPINRVSGARMVALPGRVLAVERERIATLHSLMQPAAPQVLMDNDPVSPAPPAPDAEMVATDAPAVATRIPWGWIGLGAAALVVVVLVLRRRKR